MQCLYIKADGEDARRAALEARFAAHQAPGWTLTPASGYPRLIELLRRLKAEFVDPEARAFTALLGAALSDRFVVK